MPKELEQKLQRTAEKRGYSKERKGAFVYGTMRKAGWKPGMKKYAKSGKKSKKTMMAAVDRRLAGMKKKA